MRGDAHLKTPFKTQSKTTGSFGHCLIERNLILA
jgi:hypothetical protein